MLSRRDAGKLALGAAGTLALPARRARAAAGRPTLTIAVDNLWSTMAPINGISITAQRIFPNFYEKLVTRDFINDAQGLRFAPRLATQWTQDGNVWRFTIRQGVKFHDGTELTAEDVAFSLGADRLWGPKPFEPRGRTFTVGFVRVEAVSPDTVEIETARPDQHIPQKLSGSVGPIVPKKYYLEAGVDKFGQAPIGTGPYKVASFRSGEAMILEAFDDYWGGAPPAERLIFKIVPEFAGRLAGLVSGEFDFIVNIPTDQEETLAGYKNVKLVRKLADNYPAVTFNTLPDPPDNPLVDANLRYAMCRGVDMDAIVASLFGDATFHPAVPFNFPEYGPFYQEGLKSPLAYDPDAARALVKASGYKGQRLRWNIPRQFYPNYEVAAEIMVEQWREIGVMVDAAVLDNFDLVYRRPFHMMGVSMASNFIPGDPYQPLWLDWGPTAPRSTAAWKTWTPSEEFVARGKTFEEAQTFDDRNKAYLALTAEWQRVTPALFLWKSIYNWAHRDGLTWLPAAGSEMHLYGDHLKLDA